MKIDCGLWHSLVLTSDGKIWTFGNRKRGQLGPKPAVNPWTPVLVNLPEFCVDLAAGQSHSVAVGNSGFLYAWGEKKFGQSGAEVNPKKQEFQEFNVIKSERKFCKVSSGWTHNLASDSEGILWAWGRGDYGQLGQGSEARTGFEGSEALVGSESSEARIGSEGSEGSEGPEAKEVGSENSCASSFFPLQIPNLRLDPENPLFSCGSEHNAAISADKKLYTWGWNEHGMCGNGSEANVFKPIQIYPNRKWVNVSCGAGHTVALAAKN